MTTPFKFSRWRACFLAALTVLAALIPAGCSFGGWVAATTATASAATSAPVRAATTPSGDGLFLIITDIHFDPFADTALAPQLAAAPIDEWRGLLDGASDGSFSPYGSDSNWELMKSALRTARNAAQSYDYVLYAGDYISHGFNADYDTYIGGGQEGLQDFVIKTMKFVGEELHRHFPEAPLLGTLGNNDAICGDYMIAPESPLLAALQDQWGQLSGDPTAFSDFKLGGYYAIPHPTVPDHDFIVLNSIFWSQRYVDQCGPPGIDPGVMQLEWLRWKLSKARLEGRHVSLLMHVPIGMNAYSSAGSVVCTPSPTPFMHERYSKPLLATLRAHASLLGNGFAGHTHMDSFRVASSSDGTPFLALRITPSVSPIFDNNPSFAVVVYDRTTSVQKDYRLHYLTNLSDVGSGDPPVWAVEYDFDLAYGEPGFGPAQALAVADKIQSDVASRSNFMQFYAVSSSDSSPVTEQNWKVFACAQTALTAEEFEDCTCED